MKKLLCLFIVLFSLQIFSGHGSNTRKHYIVYMGTHSFPDSESLITSNHDMLASVIGSLDDAKNSVVHHYHKSFRGFSAMLTPEHAKEIKKNESVVSVFESKLHKLQTTRSWDFMGAPATSLYTQNSLRTDYDVIVGHFDSGIWPEAPSFRPNGFSPVPQRWRGVCNDVACNGKIIGHRFYNQGFQREYGPINPSSGRHFLSARDDYGHGTHTASIAVGSFLENVNIGAIGSSTVRGGAPNARIAVYKVCWNNYCSCADVLAAYDDAIHDNVDVITMSLGQPPIGVAFLDDCFNIGALHAFQNGILVSASAGNTGDAGSVLNVAPWILTVGASSIDREFVAWVNLGNGISLKGHGYNPEDMDDYYPLVDASTAGILDVTGYARFCKPGTLDRGKTYGAVVVCTMENPNDSRQEKVSAVSAAGGAGVIIIDPMESEEIALSNTFPIAIIGSNAAQTLIGYIRTINEPSAFISKTQINLNVKPAPRVASFSSRGPGNAPSIIKPDIIAPGANIIAAYPAWDYKDPHSLVLEVMHGTSMACPHASGVAALLKADHPDWSPAEIKSALMTTALVTDNTGMPIKSGFGDATPFDLGSGHLNPSRALNPGLVYDFTPQDIVGYLCSHSAGRERVGALVGRTTCPFPFPEPYNLNHPSIQVEMTSSDLVKVYRTATYRGYSGDPTVFQLKVEQPEGIFLQVNPQILDFSNGQKTITFTVDIQVQQPLNKYVFGSITWYNNVHIVRSPVAIRVSA